MKLKSLIALTALIAVAIVTDHRATAAGSYAITQLDANSGFPRGVAFYISDNGVVAGSVADDEIQKAFVWTAATGLQLISLGGSIAASLAISPNGIVIGASFTPGDAEVRGFVWTATTGVTEIEGLGGSFTFPSDVNSSGVVVGESETSSGERHGFMWTAAGGTVDLDPAGSSSIARFVSENGVIVGETRTESGAQLFAVTPSGRIEIGRFGEDIFAERMNRNGSVTGSYFRDDDTFGAFFWSIATGLVDIGPFAGPEIYATALSENDIVAGFGVTETGVEVGYVWTVGEGLVTIPSLGGDSTFPNAVNSSGLVAGFSATSNGKDHAFAWTEAGGLVDLGTLQGGSDSFAYIVTEDGTVIGSSDVKGKQQRAFTWTAATGMVELPSLGGSLNEVLGANASGVLVGVSSFKGITDERAVMWTPAAAAFGPFEKLDPPPAFNAAKAGKTVDLTFSLGGDHGLDIFADGYPAMRVINCESGEPEEAPTAALGALSYNPKRGVYTYAWLTSNSWVGCRELALQLQGGGSQSVNFIFK